METIKYLVFILVGTFFLVNAKSVLGNGRTVAQPANAQTFTANVKLNTGDEVEILRAKLVEGEATHQYFNVSMGGVTRQIYFYDIKNIRFLSETPDSDGFMKADISLIYDLDESSVMVRVFDKNTMSHLRGFGRNGSVISVALPSCKQIEFPRDPSHFVPTILGNSAIK